MSVDDVAFMLEAIDCRWVFKFKSKKMGVDFYLCKDTKMLPEGEIGFTAKEFIEISKMEDPSEAIKAKVIFQGSKIIAKP